MALGHTIDSDKWVSNTNAVPKFVILAAAAAIVVAGGWTAALAAAKSIYFEQTAAGYAIAKNIQYSYTLQNKTNRLVDRAEFWVQAPVKQRATQLCLGLTANYPFQINTDQLGNQVLHFTFEKLGPYATRIITIKANLMVSSSANPIAVAPEAPDLLPEKYVESDHPEIRRLAGRLEKSNAIETIKAVFGWIARYVRYSGYTAKDRGALFALRHRKGDCTEYMDLFVALLRANGLPSRRVGGYICPQNAVLKARDYHNWGEFYQESAWQIADPQNNVLMQNQDDYIAMHIIRTSQDNPLGTDIRFRVKGSGLKAKMN